MNKKARYVVISLILSLLSLIIIFAFIYNFSNFGKKEADIQVCQTTLTLLSNPGVANTYFGRSEDTITPEFIDIVKNTCNTNNYEIENSNIAGAITLIDECWRKMGSGKDILGRNVYGQSLCIYCGEIRAKDNVEEFSEKLSQKLSESDFLHITQGLDLNKNLNSELLSLDYLPQNLNEAQTLGVFYLILRPEICTESGIGNCVGRYSLNFLSSQVSGLSPLASTILSFAGSSYQSSISGIFLSPVIEGEFSENRNSLRVAGEELVCTTLIIPEIN